MASQPPDECSHVQNYVKLRENPCRVILSISFIGQCLPRLATRLHGDVEGNVACSFRETLCVSEMVPLTHEAEMPLRFMSPSKGVAGHRGQSDISALSRQGKFKTGGTARR